MKRTIVLGILVILLGASIPMIPTQANGNSIPQGAYTTDIIAGGGNGHGTDVGDLIIWNNGTHLFVKYCMVDATPCCPFDNWYLTLTHLEIASSLSDIPQTRKGSPIPGQFEYHTYHGSPGVTEFTYCIPWTTYPAYIAAHGEARQYCFDGQLPTTIRMDAVHGGGPTYFEVHIMNGGILNGYYHGWCADIDHVLNEEIIYCASVYANYGLIPADKIEHPENLDCVNWLLNQHFVGKESCGGFGDYTYGDVQQAIWTLLDEAIDYSLLGPWCQDRVDELLQKACCYGEGFEPECGQIKAIVLCPNQNGQTTIIEVCVPCCENREETVWGEGTDFPGANWGMYIVYNPS